MNPVILRLTPKLGASDEELDFSVIFTSLANGEPVNLNAYDVEMILSPIDSFKGDFLRYLSEHGFKSYVTRGLLTEAVLSTQKPAKDALDIIQLYLDNIMIQDELIIVDPYFFSSGNNPAYTSFIIDIFSKYIKYVSKLIVITSPSKVETNTKSSIISGLHSINPSISIEHKTSTDIHDRFVISSSRTKGVLLGTSFNSLGRKLSIIDKLDDSDVLEIITTLSNVGVIT